MEQALKVVEKKWESVKDMPLAQGTKISCLEFLAKSDRCKNFLPSFQITYSYEAWSPLNGILLYNQENGTVRNRIVKPAEPPR